MQLEFIRSTSNVLEDKFTTQSFVYSNYRKCIEVVKNVKEGEWIALPTDSWGVFRDKKVVLPHLDPCCGIVMLGSTGIAVVGHMIPEFHMDTLNATLDCARDLLGDEELEEIVVAGMSTRGLPQAVSYRRVVLEEIEKRQFSYRSMRICWNSEEAAASAVRVDITARHVEVITW